MDQCAFDELINFVLQTVSSEEYLRNIGIHRPNPMQMYEFDGYLQQDNYQMQEFIQGRGGRRPPKQIIIPGIYPIMAGSEGSMHYLGVRSNGGVIQIANGYPDPIGRSSNYFGLDAQPDHSHGLCQTFALMFHFGMEDSLGKGRVNYLNNVRIGLNFLYEMIADGSARPTRELAWNPNNLVNNIERLCVWGVGNHDKDLQNAINRSMVPGGQVYLSLIIKNVLLNPYYQENLNIVIQCHV